jgi:hypothetical protein
MPLVRAPLVALLAAALASSGCTGRVEAGLDAFREGRLPAAARTLRREEQRARDAGGRTLHRYALQRGLVELGLGNARPADAWLALALRADRADPGLFDDDERGALFAAVRSMGRLPGDARARDALPEPQVQP